MNTMRNCALMLAVCLFMQGCVGVAVKDAQTRVFDCPSVKDKMIAPSTGDDPVRNGINGIIGASPDAGPYDRVTMPTVTWLRDHWGDPTIIKRVPDEKREIWTYRFDRVWCGIMPCVVVPIPMFLPTGREKVVFVLSDGKVVSAEVTQARLSWTGATLFSPEGPFCGSFSN